MLYSSCKNNLIDMVETKLQIEIEKKVRDEDVMIHTWAKLCLIQRSSTLLELSFHTFL